MRRALASIAIGCFVVALAACVGGPGPLPDQGSDQASQGGGITGGSGERAESSTESSSSNREDREDRGDREEGGDPGAPPMRGGGGEPTPPPDLPPDAG